MHVLEPGEVGTLGGDTVRKVGICIVAARTNHCPTSSVATFATGETGLFRLGCHGCTVGLSLARHVRNLRHVDERLAVTSDFEREPRQREEQSRIDPLIRHWTNPTVATRRSLVVPKPINKSSNYLQLPHIHS